MDTSLKKVQGVNTPLLVRQQRLLPKCVKQKGDCMNAIQTDNCESKWRQVATLLGIDKAEFLGGVERCDFTIEKLPQIIKLGFTTLDYKCNRAPAVEVFYEFGKRAARHGATVHFEGFLESQYRKDPRLVIEGVRVTNFPDSAKLVMDFAQAFHGADEFTSNAELLRAWYD